MKKLLLMMLLAGPVWAEDKPAPNVDLAAVAVPGGVATYVAALRLADLGVAGKDPLQVLTAARMLRGLKVTPDARVPDGGKAGVVTVPDVAGMFDAARGMGAGGLVADLIEAVAAEVPPAGVAVRASTSVVEPGKSDHWKLAFYGGVFGEVAVIGMGLGVVVADEAGTVVCQNAASDRTVCGFTPVANGYFEVTVTNDGAGAQSYELVTN